LQRTPPPLFPQAPAPPPCYTSLNVKESTSCNIALHPYLLFTRNHGLVVKYGWKSLHDKAKQEHKRDISATERYIQQPFIHPRLQEAQPAASSQPAEADSFPLSHPDVTPDSPAEGGPPPQAGGSPQAEGAANSQRKRERAEAAGAEELAVVTVAASGEIAGVGPSPKRKKVGEHVIGRGVAQGKGWGAAMAKR